MEKSANQYMIFFLIVLNLAKQDVISTLHKNSVSVDSIISDKDKKGK